VRIVEGERAGLQSSGRGVQHLLAEWKKQREGVAEMRRRAWAEDAALQGSLVMHALPRLSTKILSSPLAAINGKLVPTENGREDYTPNTN